MTYDNTVKYTDEFINTDAERDAYHFVSECTFMLLRMIWIENFLNVVLPAHCLHCLLSKANIPYGLRSRDHNLQLLVCNLNFRRKSFIIHTLTQNFRYKGSPAPIILQVLSIHEHLYPINALTTLSLTVFTDFLQAKCDFIPKMALFRFWALLWGGLRGNLSLGSLEST